MAKIFKDKTGSWYGGDNYLSMKQQQFNAKCVANYMQNISKYDWNKDSIKAILGNLSDESNVNPQLNERGGGSGYGLVQWTPKTNLLKRARAINQYKTYDTMYTQLCVIDYEIDNHIQWITTSRYPITFKQFATNSGNHSLNYLVGAWLCNYERPADQSQAHINEREQKAIEVCAKIDWDATPSEDGGSVNGFMKWLKKIADNNEYIYIWGANHTNPPNWDSTLKAFDCSSYVSYGLHNGGGYDLDVVFTTATQKKELEELGFKVKNFNRSELKRGDILINAGVHTEVVWSVDGDNIQTIGAHMHYPDNPSKDISIANMGSGSEYDFMARPYNRDVDPPPFKKKPKIEKYQPFAFNPPPAQTYIKKRYW